MLHGRPAAHLGPVAEAAEEGGGQLAGSALGHREAVVLADHAQQPSQEAAQRSLGRHVGVEGGAGQQAAAALAAEVLLRPAAVRGGSRSGRSAAGRAAASGEPHPGPHRWKRSQHGVQQWFSHPPPLGVQAAPGVPVARMQGIEGPAVSSRSVEITGHVPSVAG